MRLLCTALGLLLLAAAVNTLCGFELVGPCQDDIAWNGWDQIREAKKHNDWDRLITLHEQEVRTGCNIASRWYELVDVLLQANRPQEALQALQEMDAHGIEVNPSEDADKFPRVRRFSTTSMFETSPLGQKLSILKGISDKRRLEFAAKLKHIPANERPPEHYIAKSACPFECCHFGNWTVLADTNLLARPGSQRIVGNVAKGGRVTALTGEVHLTPEPVVTLIDKPFVKDSIVFILDYLGEGYANIYANGKVVEAEAFYRKYCFQPFEGCWGETILPQPVPQAVWWIQVRLANGVVGWTNQSDHFGNKDSCS